jgi:hypothetical protein
MNLSDDERRQCVAAVLGGDGVRVDARAPNHWSVRFPRRPVQVALSRHWLSLSRSLPKLRAGVAATRRLLLRNASLDKGQRAVLSEGRLELCMDLPSAALPWAEDERLGPLLTGALAALRGATVSAGRAAAPSEAAVSKATVSEAEVSEAAAQDALLSSFANAGWPARRQDSGDLEVPLDVPAVYVCAQVETDAACCALRVPILDHELSNAKPVCREAVEWLLCSVASGHRMVKALAIRQQLRLAVELPTGLDEAPALASACEALSVSLREFWAEAEVLARDARLAKSFLAAV